MFGVGNAAVHRGAHEDAVAAYGEALDIQRRVVKLDETRADYRENLVPLLRYLGLAQLDAGDGAAARAAIEEAVSIGRGLTSTTPSTEPLSGLSQALSALGWLERGTGNVEAARAAHEEALALDSRVLELKDDDPENVRNLAVTLFKLADFELSIGDRERAPSHCRRCVEVVRRFAAMVGENWYRLDYPVDCLEWLGDTLRGNGERDEASLLRAEWLKLQRRLAEPAGASEETLQIFASALRQVVLELEGVGGVAEARVLRDEQVLVEERLRRVQCGAVQPNSLPT